MLMAIEEGALAENEHADREAPKAGAVAASEAGALIARAHRGEPVDHPGDKTEAGDHAEYTLLKKCRNKDVRGATVFTTLEPCISRHHSKRSCAEHLIDVGVGRVVIGMVDPNPLMSGRGIGRLRQANVEVAFFPKEYAKRVEAQNENFAEYQRGPRVELDSPGISRTISCG